MKLLTFSTLYPNAATPNHGVFVENRLRHLVASGRTHAKVVAPVPWFPFASPRFGRYSAYANVPRREDRFGIDISHPRFFTLPFVGINSAPLAMALAARPTIASLLASGFAFDAIDAHYFYPDGVAAALLARWFDKPLVITARGSDINLLPAHPIPRRMILWAARRASAIVTVCTALKTTLFELGVDETKITVLRNGVDLAGFSPIDPATARKRLSLPTSGQVIASVGRLVPLKGHDLVLEALSVLPETMLLIAGSGPEDESLRAKALHLGLAERVRFLGQIAHADLPLVYSASNALVLASSQEGWANVLLEAMACGTPAVATDVGGSREVIDAPEAGLVIETRSSSSIASGLRRMLATPPDRAATRRYAERFSWDETTHGQERLFGSLLHRPVASWPSARS